MVLFYTTTVWLPEAEGGCRQSAHTIPVPPQRSPWVPGSAVVLIMSFALILDRRCVSPAPWLLPQRFLSGSLGCSFSQQGFLTCIPTVFTTCDAKDIFHNPPIDSHGSVFSLMRSEIFLWCSNLQSLVTSEYQCSSYYCLSPLGLITRLLSTSSLYLSGLRLLDTALLWSCSLLVALAVFSGSCLLLTLFHSFFSTHHPSSWPPFLIPVILGFVLLISFPASVAHCKF